MTANAPQPLVAIVGPTGAGKSALALHLAGAFRAEIVNCDSLQVFRQFDIGTAKVTAAERAAAPHHLLDIVDPEGLFTAGDYARLGREALAAIAGRNNVPMIVGGTGFYLKALLDGLFEGPQRDEALRQRLAVREQKRAGSLHRLLRRFDAAAAGRIHANDKNKTMRAVEICLLARRPVSELFRQGTAKLEGFAPILIGLDPPRAELYERLNRRAAAMFEEGLVEEVRGILARGVRASAKPFESLGYRQALAVVEGKCTWAEAVEDTQKQTRHYAKRQWTWFKRDTRVSWIPGFGHWPQTQQNALLTVVTQFPGVEIFFR
ncbi:MAG: tRNA (adenosine(37)-N6)-dimethylallyltransferase MiaA [Bryobacterales bacterium]|nr:tRNA (adenosine(37)-N6)-dimethylallyltransferase MiaA [Bryobacterales bacterium]